MADAVDLFVCGAHKVDALFMSARFQSSAIEQPIFFRKDRQAASSARRKECRVCEFDRSGFTLRLAARLRVKRIEMAHGSLHEEIDNVFGLA